MDVKRYLFDKLIFPRVFIIDKPGVIINKTIGKFGKEGIKTRVIYHFEDFVTELYKETVKKIGKEKTYRLWYNINKDTSFRYTLFANKQIPKILVPLVIKYIFKTLSGAGITFGERILFSGNSYVFQGKNCVICNKIQGGAMMAGTASGILSSVIGKNIEAEARCVDCPKKCLIEANFDIKTKHLPSIKELMPFKDYNKLNFPNLSKISFSSDFNSFTDLLKFGKIKMEKSSNVFLFQNKIIIPSEIGLAEIILTHYEKLEELSFAKNVLINTSYRIATEIFEKDNSFKNNIKMLKIILSAFGWGMLFIKRNYKGVLCEFKHPPFNKGLPFFRAFILNGYINFIFKNDFQIKKISNTRILFGL